MTIEKGLLKSFNSTNYTATIMLSGSLKASLEKIAVARNLSSAVMTSGRKVLVFFPDGYTSKDAVIIAVYGT
jgi:hypothetical protein